MKQLRRPESAERGLAARLLAVHAAAALILLLGGLSGGGLAAAPHDLDADSEACPCFEVQDLVILGAAGWDICQADAYVIQIMRWLDSEPVPATGQLGYHLVAVRPNPRGGRGSCQYLLRTHREGSEESVYRRYSALDDEAAEACFDLVETWLEDAGGCKDEPEVEPEDRGGP